MRRKDLNAGMQEYIDLLLKEERYSTAKSYQDAWNSFIRFSGLSSIPYTFINKDTLRRYECYLLHNGCKRNTVSTYMRRLRCIYNRAVEQGDAPYVPRLFSDVFTGVESKCKRSLPLTELHKLMTVPVPRPALRSTQLAICLMFQYGGISFVDFAHLKKDNFQDDCLVYHRQKTGTTIQLEKLKSSLKMQSELSHSTPALSPYVFPFLSGSKKGKDSYWEYQGALQSFNRHLKKLGEYAGIRSKVTSYSIRHSFANLLKEQHVPIEVISELLGHRSIRTTQIYLRSFSLEYLRKTTESCFKKVYFHK